MVALPDDRRVLLAPDERVAEYVSQTYKFDEVRVAPVQARLSADTLVVSAGVLSLTAALGGRTALGRLLHLLPPRLASAPLFSRLTDPVARVVMPGVRTAGSAGHGRREFYGATDLRCVQAIDGTWDGTPLGSLAPVQPSPRFGFSSTPRTPGLTSVTTTILVPSASETTGARR